MAPPTAASIVANGVKANGKAPEPEPAAGDEGDKPAPVEDKDVPKVEAKEDGEEVRCGAVWCGVASGLLFFLFWYPILQELGTTRTIRTATGWWSLFYVQYLSFTQYERNVL